MAGKMSQYSAGQSNEHYRDSRIYSLLQLTGHVRFCSFTILLMRNFSVGVIRGYYHVISNLRPIVYFIRWKKASARRNAKKTFMKLFLEHVDES